VQEGLTFKEEIVRLSEKSLTTTNIGCITSQKSEGHFFLIYITDKQSAHDVQNNFLPYISDYNEY